MNLESMTKNEILELAKTTSDAKVLSKLSSSIDSTVREAVAKNIYTPKEVLSLLANDSVMNVSYLAHQNSNFSADKVFIGQNI